MIKICYIHRKDYTKVVLQLFNIKTLWIIQTKKFSRLTIMEI